MSMLEWWRNRNERWARANLTVRKYEKIQKNYRRIERLGPLKYFTIAILGMMAWVLLVSFVAGFALGTIGRLRHQPDPFYLREYFKTNLEFSLAIAVTFSLFHYFMAREAAKWPRPESGR